VLGQIQQQRVVQDLWEGMAGRYTHGMMVTHAVSPLLLQTNPNS